MSNLDDVRRLKEEIITSFDERMGTIANVVKSTSEMASSTREMTSRFRTEHRAMSDELRSKLQNMKKKLSDDNNLRRKETQDEIKQRLYQLSDLLTAFRSNGNSEFSKSVNEMLGNFRVARLEDFNKFMQDLQHRVDKIKDGVKNMQIEFRQSHQEMSSDLNQFLSDFRSNLKDFKENLSHIEKERFKQAQMDIKERTAYLEKLFNDVTVMVSEFRNDHSEMTKILKKMISFDGFNKERIHDFNDMLRQIKENQQRREQDTLQMLADFNQTHDEMSQNLFDMLSATRAGLKQSDHDRRNQAHVDMHSRLDYIRNLKAEISNLLTRLREESQEVMREWNDLSRILEEKSQQAPSAKAEMKTKAKPETKPAKPEKIPNNVTNEPEDLPDGEIETILAIITKNSADGIRLAEISKKMGKKWQTLIPQVKSLLENGKIKKQDSLYFPI